MPTLHKLLPSALYPLPSAFCPLPSVLCLLPSALCPLPSAFCYIIFAMRSSPLKTTLFFARTKRIARGLLIVGAGTMAAIAIGIFTPRQWGPVSKEPCAFTLYVSGDNFHTNLTLPLRTDAVDWRQHLHQTTLASHLNASDRWLSIGWGDRDFYMDTPRLQDLELPTTLRALFWPTETVLLIQGHHSLPIARSPYQVKPVQVSRAAYLRLTEFILSSFARDSAGQPIPMQSRHRYNGNFYAARGHYFLFRTCNDWTATGLRVANVNTPLWSGLAPSIFYHARGSCKLR